MIPGFIPCQFCCFIIRPYLVSTSVPCPSTERELTHSYCLKLFHLKSLSILHPHHLDVLVQSLGAILQELRASARQKAVIIAQQRCKSLPLGHFIVSFLIQYAKITRKNEIDDRA